jgi:hypothetical protein
VKAISILMIPVLASIVAGAVSAVVQSPKSDCDIEVTAAEDGYSTRSRGSECAAFRVVYVDDVCTSGRTIRLMERVNNMTLQDSAEHDLLQEDLP